MRCHNIRETLAAGLLVGCTMIVPAAAEAAGLQAVIRTVIEDSEGLTSGNIELFLNDTPLPVLPEQTVTLEPLDRLRAEVSASATHEPGLRVISDRAVTVELTLDPGVTNASVRTIFFGSAETTPVSEGGSETGRGGIGQIISCDFFTTEACSAIGPPPGALSYTSGVESKTNLGTGNEITVNNVKTETGRIGGPEVFDLLSTTLNLQQPQGSGPPTQIRIAAQGDAIFQTTAAGTASWDLLVTQLNVIPIPAAAWLFASALLAIGWTRRAKA